MSSDGRGVLAADRWGRVMNSVTGTWLLQTSAFCCQRQVWRGRCTAQIDRVRGRYRFVRRLAGRIHERLSLVRRERAFLIKDVVFRNLQMVSINLVVNLPFYLGT